MVESVKQFIRLAQNSPEGGTEGPQLCLMAKHLLIFPCLTVFFCLCIFLTFLIK